MVDNFDKFYDKMVFINPDDFYFLQILKRRKDNPGMPRDQKLIDTYFLYSMDEYLKYKGQIKDQCNLNNARCYIHVNVRNAQRIGLEHNKIVGFHLASGSYKSIASAYNTACGKYHSADKKQWIVDVDNGDEFPEVAHNIHKLHKVAKVESEMYFMKTKNGYHLICRPFRMDKFKEIFPNIDVQKDGPTLLYCP